MKHLLFLILLAVSLNLSAEIKQSEINGHKYECLGGKNHTGIAIKTTAPHIVWLADADNQIIDRTGMELEDLEINVARCAHCLSFKGKLDNGNDILLASGQMKGDPSSKKIDLTLTLNSNEYNETLYLKCRLAYSFPGRN